MIESQSGRHAGVMFTNATDGDIPATLAFYVNLVVSETCVEKSVSEATLVHVYHEFADLPITLE